MTFSNLKYFFLSAGLCLALLNSSYADTLNTQLSRDKVALGESFTLTFTLDSNSNTSPDFSALKKDFTILGTNYGNAVNIINGVGTTQTFWQLSLEPKKAGVIVIPEINFGKIKSSVQQLTVVENVTDVTTDHQDPSIFVDAQLSTTTPYIQSQVLYTFKIFYQSQIENPKVEIPEIKDATVVELDNGSHYQTTVKGKPYLVVEKNFAVFPQKTGNILLPPFHFQALTADINQSIMNSPFDINEPKPIQLATKSFNLTVKKIPAEFVGKTWLPAKNLSITEKWSMPPEQWESGNPVTRTIMVEARGLRADQIPDLAMDKTAGINMYVDPPKRSNTINDNLITGVLEQKITYIPNAAGSFTIPALQLNWWDLEKDNNAIAQLLPISVHAKGKINNSTAMETTPPAALAARVAPTHAANAATTTFYLSIWFWVAILLFVIWLLTLWLIWDKRAVKDQNLNPSSKKLTPAATIPELSDKRFIQACEEGNAALAQQFLLSWAKQQGQDILFNLDKLRDIVPDENFKNELKNLEQALYSKKPMPWNGQNLLAIYQKIKKSGKIKPIKAPHSLDPLPPLNP